MKIKTKLLLLAMTACIVALFIGTIGMIGMNNLNASIAGLNQVVMPSQIHANKIKAVLHEMQTLMAEVLVNENDYSAEVREKFRKLDARYEEIVTTSNREIEAYTNIPRPPEIVARMVPLEEAFKNTRATWRGETRKMSELLDQLQALPAGDEKGQKALMAQVLTVYHQQAELSAPVVKVLEDIFEFEENRAAEIEHANNSLAHRMVTLQVGALVVGLGLVLAIAVSVFRAVMKPLELTRSTVGKIAANNDLTQRVDLHSTDEFGLMVNDFNGLIQRLHDALSGIQGSVDGVLSTATSLSSAAAQVAGSSTSQASATSAMAASVEEMTVSINTVSSSAEDAQQLAVKAGASSARGGEIIHRSSAGMVSIAESVGDASRVITELGEESKQISDVVQVIKEVADQTNLPALNAAIEAARAGEQGRGFAVVADEVRKLAERTAQSTVDIGVMIGKIQTSANDAVVEMQKVVEQVSVGKDLAESAGVMMASVEEDAGKVSSAVTEISNALKEQSQASQEIARHVETIAQMTDENNAAAAETSSNAQHLQDIAQAAGKAVAVFRI
ncbi:MAG: methyl-accepting chemotaxis protein [Zoogloeaceae bacterium]|jgi:methyl-accepting chemotaxis protein|nr:methyl-accepting chemotaxis protein [Zoogloeaceae bacterium]